MLRILLISCLIYTTASAQTAPTNSSPIETNRLTAADTIRALHNLFKSKRNTGGWLAYGSAGVTAITGVGTLAGGRGNDPYFSPDAFGASLLIAIGLAPAWIPGTVTLFRFTKKREQKAVEAYEKAKTIPQGLQKRLSGRFFNTNYRFSKK